MPAPRSGGSGIWRIRHAGTARRAAQPLRQAGAFWYAEGAMATDRVVAAVPTDRNVGRASRTMDADGAVAGPDNATDRPVVDYASGTTDPDGTVGGPDSATDRPVVDYASRTMDPDGAVTGPDGC